MHFALGADADRFPSQAETRRQRDGTAELKNSTVFADVVDKAIEGRAPLDQSSRLKQRRAAPKRRPLRSITQRRHGT